MIRWIIQEKLGTAPANADCIGNDVVVLDVRDLVDRSGNSANLIKSKIGEGVAFLESGKRVIVCCDYGISRSNAIAAGILSKFNKVSLSTALKEVIYSTGEKEIKIDVLNMVRLALNEKNNENDSIQKNILVTGGSGFVGKALLPLLNTKYNCFAPSSSDIDLLNGAAELDLYVKENKVSHIVHLANPRTYTSNKSLGITLTMLRNVLEVCKNNNVTLVYPSSWEIYSGYASNCLLADESLPPNPKGPYGETKWLCENLIKLFIEKHNLKVAMLRSCPLYGVGGERPKFLWSFIDYAKKALPIKTHCFLNGSPSLDLMYVEDFSSAIVAILDKNYCGYMNFGTGRLISTKEAAEIICGYIKSDSTIESVAISEYAPNIAMNNSLARQILGWEASIRFEDGIKRLIGGV
ncbi:MAG: NAD-dependent epimerase/dehydratase family protein [Fibromonadales bacterium]|nr:NAD-dependent epimerase/dehydratase family protein [Fibromonadales bacterium]